MRFSVVAIPLNRPEIQDFLTPHRLAARGAVVEIVGQRPSVHAEDAWVARLRRQSEVTAADLIAIGDPHGYLHATTSDRLVPAEFLREPGFLTRNLGGWSPVYFGVIGADRASFAARDPLLEQAAVLADYGSRIVSYDAAPEYVAARLERETDSSPKRLARHIVRLHSMRAVYPTRREAIDGLYTQIATDQRFDEVDEGPIPRLLLLDELMGQMVRLERRRRAAVAEGDSGLAEEIEAWQTSHRANSGLQLILKGEYIVGRHRRSTVLIAPELEVVIKQPAPEPFHEIELGAIEYEGQPENWPYLTHSGALVMPRGRLQLTVAEDLVPRLHRVFGHNVQFSVLLGLVVEPYVTGPTVQELVLAQPRELNADLYDVFVLHQQVCEALRIENGDWHAANFIVRETDHQIVHVDWGAARPLRQDELTEVGRLARLNQVRNIAYSFHDERLAATCNRLHEELLQDPVRQTAIRERAEKLAAGG